MQFNVLSSTFYDIIEFTSEHINRMVLVNSSSNCKKWRCTLINGRQDEGGSISSQIEGKQIKVLGTLETTWIWLKKYCFWKLKTGE